MLLLPEEFQTHEIRLFARESRSLEIKIRENVRETEETGEKFRSEDLPPLQQNFQKGKRDAHSQKVRSRREKRLHLQNLREGFQIHLFAVRSQEEASLPGVVQIRVSILSEAVSGQNGIGKAFAEAHRGETVYLQPLRENVFLSRELEHAHENSAREQEKF